MVVMDWRFWLESILRSYSLIFFSRYRALGGVILAATLITPSHGLFGLFGAALANLFAFLLGYNRQEIRQGFWGFNGVLIALGLGLYYDVSPQLIALIAISVFFMTLFTAWIKNFLAVYGLPYMSLPFNLVIYAAIVTSFGTGYLTPSIERWQLLDISLNFLPGWFNLFCKNLGAIFFTIHPLSGLLIALGLLIFSRLSLLLMLLGWYIGYSVHAFFGVNPYLIEHQYLGFNYMLTALALGGVFVIPNIGSLFLAAAGVLIAFLNLIALEIVLPYYLSSLALAFNITVLMVVYALKVRLYPSLGILLSANPVSPEENLSQYRENLQMWRRYGVQISLPFFGEWVVSQAFHGEYTHKDDWAYGMDFMIQDEGGKIYRGQGARLSDYHCYDVPVLAPAPGKVVVVKNDTPDNPPGQTNPRDNWGNCVIIEHAPYYYSCLAHLKRNTICVKEGDEVEKGQKIGHCGNSGRSPYPHIHLQFQTQPYVGAPSIYFEFSNVVIRRKDARVLVPRGTLQKDDRVENLRYDEAFERYFPAQFDREWFFAVRNGALSAGETWELRNDLYNNLYLEDEGGSRLYFDLTEGVLTVKKYQGRHRTALHLLAQTLVDVPFPAKPGKLQWTTQAPLDYSLPSGLVHLLDFFAILGIRFYLEIDNLLERTPDDSIVLKQHKRMVVQAYRWKRVLKVYPEPRQLMFRKGKGLAFMKEGAVELTLEKIKLRE
ncbi:MAG: hypothetical protein D6681_18895 [Calditrichaeota bacterium]|nr:MAG: hypothetical protein D6681_18895 [Calditrichota bacterium]